MLSLFFSGAVEEHAAGGFGIIHRGLEHASVVASPLIKEGLQLL